METIDRRRRWYKVAAENVTLGLGFVNEKEKKNEGRVLLISPRFHPLKNTSIHILTILVPKFEF